MSPAIVYDRSGKVVLSVGAAGGPTIPAQVAKAIVGVLDWQLSAQDALALPVIFTQDDTLGLEQDAALPRWRRRCARWATRSCSLPCSG